MSMLKRESSNHPSRITINVPESVHREIKLTALHLNVTITELVINALAHYIDFKTVKCNTKCCLPFGEKK